MSSPPPNQTVWVCVYLCVDAFPGETNRAWQSENKQSADVCVGIVSAIMLRRRHFSLIQGFFFLPFISSMQREGHKTGLHEIGKEVKNYCMDQNTTFFKKPAEEMGLFLPFSIGCAAARRPLLCVVCLQDPQVSSSLCGLWPEWAVSMKLIPNKTSLSCSSYNTLYSTQNKRKTLWTCEAFWRASV